MSPEDPSGAGGDAGLGLPVMRHRRSLREDVTQALRAAIIAGRLRPDVLYSAPTLAREFGVSPTPVREAILDLAKEDLVTIAKNKGFRVNSISDEELDEITQIRELLEVPTVAGLAGRLTDEQLRRLQSLADAIVGAARMSDVVGYIEADTAFHLTLLTFAGNSRLTALVADLRNRSRLYGLGTLLSEGTLIDSASEHLQLVELLRTKNKRAIVEHTRRHLRHVRGIWADRPETAH
ncbi:GntR family transcriptional regulator [Dactylosporangium sucinum]|uniref:GntR family transcriptional regulator n=1 Tax=Dactylosporangium sucinum TaxID=1424081 RepID=A0A917T076_9ACTN|nr:GntR family transcriptional regulator [Dactylosporangium sucinum]GGM04603.1 GntR family transcriptional regulator [Dactylosporangium sucinum]